MNKICDYGVQIGTTRHMLIVSDSKIVIHKQAVCLIYNNDIDLKKHSYSYAISNDRIHKIGFA